MPRHILDVVDKKLGLSSNCKFIKFFVTRGSLTWVLVRKGQADTVNVRIILGMYFNHQVTRYFT